MIGSKVEFRTLPTTIPPIPAGGGRIVTPAGELTQVFNGFEFRFLTYLEFKIESTSPRGNHYHKIKTEHLYVISGTLRAVYREVETGESVSRVLSAGDLVTVGPGWAHVYFPLEYSQAIEVSDVEYDPGDTIPHVVEE